MGGGLGRRIWWLVLSILTITILISCGDSTSSRNASSSSGTSTEEATVNVIVTVAIPASTSVSALTRAATKEDGVQHKGVLYTRASTTADMVMLRNNQGLSTPYRCTTVEGSCELSITQSDFEELFVDEGVILKSDNGDMVEHAYVQLTQTAADALIAGGGSLDTAVSPVTDIAYATTKGQCGGDLNDCGDIDVRTLNESLTDLFAHAGTATDSEKTIRAIDYLQDMVTAHQDLIVASTDGAIPAADAMANALVTGDTEALSVSFEFSETVDNTASVADVIADAYCTRASDGTIEWDELKSDATAQGVSFDGKAIVGFVSELKVDELDEVATIEIVDAARGLMAVPDLLSQSVQYPKVMASVAEMIRVGSFATGNARMAETAIGWLGSMTLGMSGSDIKKNLNPKNVAFSAYLMANDYMSASTQLSAQDIVSLNKATLSSPTMHQALTGGTMSFGGYMSNFKALGTSFTASNYSGAIGKSAGASCAFDNSCDGHSTCVNGLCQTVSATNRKSCDSGSDCAPFEVCIGHIKRYCLTSAAVPKDTFVYAAANTAQKMNPEDMISRSGGLGSTCDKNLKCAAGQTCSSTGPGAFGFCMPSSGYGGRAPGATCGGNTECASGTCNRGRCQAGDYFKSGNVVGEACVVFSDCATGYCSSGFCDVAPTSFQTAYYSAGTLMADGGACTLHYQCGSGVCESGRCKSFYSSSYYVAGGHGDSTTQGTVTVGQACYLSSDCAASFACIAGVCSMTSASANCGKTSDCLSPTITYCKDYVCNARVANAQACRLTATSTAADSCQSGNCVAGTCQAQTQTQSQPTNTTCTADSQCSASQYCGVQDPRQCLADKANGQTCSVSTECTSNFCSGGTCQQQPTDACTSDAQCVASQYCGVQSPRQCLADKTNGQVCQVSTECISNLCVSGICQAPIQPNLNTIGLNTWTKQIGSGPGGTFCATSDATRTTASGGPGNGPYTFTGNGNLSVTLGAPSCTGTLNGASSTSGSCTGPGGPPGTVAGSVIDITFSAPINCRLILKN